MAEQNHMVVLATGNQGKIREMKRLLDGKGLEILGLNDFGPLPEAREDAESFEENAYQKASFYARILGYPALADDSGLCVAALGGAPGVRSARFAGPEASDEDRWKLLLKKMEGQKDRRASFICALVLAVPLGPALTWTGEAAGEITTAPAGEGGFGYDPVFFYPPLGRTFAQLGREEKNQVSHRGRALAEFTAELDKVKRWLDQRLGEANPPHHHG